MDSETLPEITSGRAVWRQCKLKIVARKSTNEINGLGAAEIRCEDDRALSFCDTACRVPSV